MPRQGTLGQVALAVIGFAIVGAMLIGPHTREGITLVTTRAGVVTPNVPAVHLQSPLRAAPAESAPAAPAAPAAPGADPVAAPAAPAAPRATAPEAPAAPAVAGRQQAGARATAQDRTLVADNFERDPLAAAVPSGWRLDDTQPVTDTVPILGGLPIVGGLVSSAQRTVNLTPSTVLDGSHVLVRGAGSWSHLSLAGAGSGWVDYSASADVKPLSSATGFLGVAGRYQGAGDQVACGIRDGNSLQLLQVVSGSQRLLSSTAVAVTPNAFHTVRIQMSGTRVTCSIDAVTTLSGTVSSITGGRVGLVASGDAAAEFDNVQGVTNS